MKPIGQTLIIQAALPFCTTLNWNCRCRRAII